MTQPENTGWSANAWLQEKLGPVGAVSYYISDVFPGGKWTMGLIISHLLIEC